jgi:LAS superfamily LD-carboxypeptidase LdcB
MSEPLFVGMPSVDTRFVVPRTGTKDPKDSWGEIRCGGPCKDDYARIKVHTQDAQHFLKLQQAAINSIVAAEAKLKFPIICTGSWRACGTQTQLFAQDPQRFANPDKTAHTRGLAIDVNQLLPKLKLTGIDKALKARGWHQARDDEPWHYSFGIQV